MDIYGKVIKLLDLFERINNIKWAQHNSTPMYQSLHTDIHFAYVCYLFLQLLNRQIYSRRLNTFQEIRVHSITGINYSNVVL